MKIQVLGCCGEGVAGFYTTSFLINDHLLLDAGDIGGILKIEDQRKITDILLTHAHLDHVVGLPFLGDAIWGQIEGSILITGIQEVINYLHQYIFNGKIWPDLTKLPHPDSPVFRLNPIQVGQACSLAEFKITPLPVCHPVPAVGYLVQEEKNDVAILYSGDTGCIQEIIKIINQTENIKTLLIEISFPNRLKKLAEQAGHLTPSALYYLFANLNKDIKVWLCHMKPQYVEEITQECLEFKEKINILKRGEIFYISPKGEVSI